MKMDLSDCMAAGVFVEFQDVDGHILAQSVFTEWHSRSVPGVGDTMRCRARGVASGRDEHFAGRVVGRHFEVQHDDGRECVWVRLIVNVQAAARPRGRQPVRFSTN
jgi:hypothetical protein